MVNSKGLEFQAHVSMIFFSGSSTGKSCNFHTNMRHQDMISPYISILWPGEPGPKALSIEDALKLPPPKRLVLKHGRSLITWDRPEHRSIEAHLSLECQSWKNSKLNRFSTLVLDFQGGQRYGNVLQYHTISIDHLLSNSNCWICSDLSRTFQAQICQ